MWLKHKFMKGGLLKQKLVVRIDAELLTNLTNFQTCGTKFSRMKT